MDDSEIRNRIESLEQEERDLRRDEQDAAAHAQDKVLADDRGRLEEIRLELDRLWDLLRQREALRESGGNPDDATPRDSGTVERYEQ